MLRLFELSWLQNAPNGRPMAYSSVTRRCLSPSVPRAVCTGAYVFSAQGTRGKYRFCLCRQGK